MEGIDDFSTLAERNGPVSPDRILSAVGNEYRRAILHTLNSESNKTLEFDTLVERVADQISAEDTERASEHRQRIRIALHHNHFPKLEELQIIDYEAETGQVQFVGGDLEQDILTLAESYDQKMPECL